MSKVAAKLFSEYYDKVSWNNIWNRRLDSGVAFEWVVFCALLYVAKEEGYEVEIPCLSYKGGSEYFLLRNDVPLNHGVQAGNSATAMNSKPLSERFFFSLIPKAIIKKGDHTLSLFREGCPYHKIMGGKNYSDRPDIIIIPGEPSFGFPRFINGETGLDFEFNHLGTALSGSLRIMNSPLIPCQRRHPIGGFVVTSAGIVECSVNKSYDIAIPQCEKYEHLFGAENKPAPISIITGNDLSQIPYNNNIVDVYCDDEKTLQQQLVKAARSILSSFSLI